MKQLKKVAKKPARTLSTEELGAATGGVANNPIYKPAGVDMNPLYVGNDLAADNPLFS